MNFASAARMCVLAGTLVGCAQLQEWWPFDKGDPPTVTPHTAPRAKRSGTLLLSGGGRTAGAVIAEAARLVGGGRGAATRIVVLPFGSTAADPGTKEAETWTHAGFRACEVLDMKDAKHAAAQIDSAAILWLSGPEPKQVIAKLRDAGLVERVRARYAAGAIVGGTNVAGTAAGELMLTGAGDDSEMVQGRAETAGGFGLWPGVIVEVHFAAKKHFNRLMAAVLDHPKHLGIGIDEETGVVVEGATLRVVGEGNVVVIDARRAKINASRPGDASAATGVEMQILSEGMTYDFEER